MFSIACVFEEESGLDAIDPLGDVEFSDGKSSITVSTTFLDSWLEALIEIVDQIQPGARLKVAAPEEAQPLHVHVLANGEVHIKNNGNTVISPSRQSFEAALRQACRVFIGRVSKLDNMNRNPVNKLIGDFCTAKGNDDRNHGQGFF